MKRLSVLKRTILVLFCAATVYADASCQSMKSIFHEEVRSAFIFNNVLSSGILSESEIVSLPDVLQDYLRYTRTVGENKVVNLTVASMGELRKGDSRLWANFVSQQYDFVESGMKVFYLESGKMGFNQKGVLSFKDGSATLFGEMSAILNYPGSNTKELAISETANLFADMIIMSPSTLADKRFSWVELDRKTALGKFKNDEIEVAFKLFFNERGQLMKIQTEDHYEFVKGKDVERIPLIFVIENYEEFGRFLLPSRVSVLSGRDNEAIEFMRYDVIDIRYNVRK